MINISASERQNCLLHLLSLEFRVLKFPAIDREPWYTGIIEHRFSKSSDQLTNHVRSVVSQLFYKQIYSFLEVKLRQSRRYDIRDNVIRSKVLYVQTVLLNQPVRRHNISAQFKFTKYVRLFPSKANT